MEFHQVVNNNPFESIFCNKQLLPGKITSEIRNWQK